jgi:hypothetical protein
VSEAKGTSLLPGQSAAFTLTGTFELHGVSRRIAILCEATRREDGTLRATARFPVRLADYGIDRPKFLVLKLDEVQQVTVELLAVPEP